MKDLAMSVLTFACLLSFSDFASAARLKGEIEDDRYISPVGFSCGVPLRNVIDGYRKNLDTGQVEFYDDFALHGIYYGPFSSVETDPTWPAKQQALESFLLGRVLLPRSPQSEILFSEPVSIDHEEMLIAAATVLERSGASNLITGKAFDAKVVALLFFRGPYVFAFTTQNNLSDANFTSNNDLGRIIEDYRSWLENYYDTCVFD